MKVGDLVKLKNKWKNVEYSPQKVENQVGVIIARDEFFWKVYWITNNSTTYTYTSSLEVIGEGG